MSKETGTLDYPAILRRMDASTREAIYRDLLGGKNGQPGIEVQFVSALVEWRSYADAVASRETYEPANEEAHAQWAKDIGVMRYMLYTRKENLNAIAAELTRLQDALTEITDAGTTT